MHTLDPLYVLWSAFLYDMALFGFLVGIFCLVPPHWKLHMLEWAKHHPILMMCVFPWLPFLFRVALIVRAHRQKHPRAVRIALMSLELLCVVFILITAFWKNVFNPISGVLLIWVSIVRMIALEPGPPHGNDESGPDDDDSPEPGAPRTPTGDQVERFLQDAGETPQLEEVLV